MDKKLQQIFKDVSQLEPTASLEGSILHAIQRRRNRQLKLQLLWSYVGLSVSTALLFAAGFVFGDALMAADFWKMLALTFSDFILVAAHWQEFGFSLLETFPFASAIAILTPLFLLLLSLNIYLNIHNNLVRFKQHKQKYI